MKSLSIFDGLFLLLLMFYLGDFGYKPGILLLCMPYMLAVLWMGVVMFLKATGYNNLPAYWVWKFSLKWQTEINARKAKQEIKNAAMRKVKNSD